MMEFHISRKARERYQFAETLFSPTTAMWCSPTWRRAAQFAHRMNQVREVEKHPEQAVHAGQLLCDGPD